MVHTGAYQYEIVAEVQTWRQEAAAFGALCRFLGMDPNPETVRREIGDSFFS